MGNRKGEGTGLGPRELAEPGRTSVCAETTPTVVGDCTCAHDFQQHSLALEVST